MMLSDGTINRLLMDGRLGISPHPGVNAIQPASVDLRLGDQFLPPWGDDDDLLKIDRHYTMAPGECTLATTLEHLRIPNNLVARVEGKSTWGRKFLMVHSTAGFVDPGFRGQITLELKNLSDNHIMLTVGQPICQVSFEWLDVPALRPYGSPGLGSHYQDQVGVTSAAA